MGAYNCLHRQATQYNPIIDSQTQCIFVKALVKNIKMCSLRSLSQPVTSCTRNGTKHNNRNVKVMMFVNTDGLLSSHIIRLIELNNDVKL